jgi:hypothetical protein
MGKKEVPYKLPIIPIENGGFSFEIAPVPPKALLAKRRRGVSVGGGLDTLEGIDSEMNEMALSFARQMHSMFGTKYSKLDAECVKQVCVYPKPIDGARISELLRQGNIAIEFKDSIKRQSDNLQLDTLSVSYGSGKLKIDGEIEPDRSIKFAGEAEELLESLDIKPAASGNVSYSKHYMTAWGYSISQKLDDVNRAVASAGNAILSVVAAPLEGRRARKEEERELIRRELRNAIAAKKEAADTDEAGAGFCIVQYDPSCLLRGKEKAQ